MQEIHNKNNKRKLQILKGFVEFDEYFDNLEKARTGRYADNSTNRRLKRVGQEYGNKKQQEPEQEKHAKKEEDDAPKNRGVDSAVENHAKNTSTEDLKKFIEGNADSELKEVAKKELEHRGESKTEKPNLSEGYHDAGEFQSKKVAQKLADRFGGKVEKDTSGMFLVKIGKDYLGQYNSNDLSYEDEYDVGSTNSYTSKEQDKKPVKDEYGATRTPGVGMSGNDFFNDYHRIWESGSFGQDLMEDINDYMDNESLGMDGSNQENEFDELPDKYKKKLSSMMKRALKKEQKMLNPTINNKFVDDLISWKETVDSGGVSPNKLKFLMDLPDNLPVKKQDEIIRKVADKYFNNFGDYSSTVSESINQIEDLSSMLFDKDDEESFDMGEEMAQSIYGALVDSVSKNPKVLNKIFAEDDFDAFDKLIDAIEGEYDNLDFNKSERIANKINTMLPKGTKYEDYMSTGGGGSTAKNLWEAMNEDSGESKPDKSKNSLYVDFKQAGKFDEEQAKRYVNIIGPTAQVEKQPNGKYAVSVGGTRYLSQR